MAGVARVTPFTDTSQYQEVGLVDSSGSEQYFGDSAEHVYAAVNGVVTYYNYALVPGRYYAVRITPGAFGTQAQIFWADAWRNLTGGSGAQSSFSCLQGGTSRCYLETGSVFHQSSDGSWPPMNAGVDGDGTNYTNIQRDDVNRTWHDWTAALGANINAEAPYSYCGISAYVDFRTPAHTYC